jgi:phosphopantothenoylcysteine synthetase/decarboxylase
MVSPAVGTTTMKPTKIVTTMMSPNKETKTVSPTMETTMLSHHRRRKPRWSADDWEEDNDVTHNGDNTVIHDAQGWIQIRTKGNSMEIIQDIGTKQK